MSFKSKINDLLILKNMLFLAYENSLEKSKAKQDLIYNPGFGNEFPIDDVPAYIVGNGYVVKKTKKGISHL